MTQMELSVLQLLEDGREYTAGEVMASSAVEHAHIETIRGALLGLYARGYVNKRGRGLHFFRITIEGRDRLFAHRHGVTL